MLSRLIEILNLLIRLLELDAKSRRGGTEFDNHESEVPFLEAPCSPPEPLERRPRPLALKAPVQAGKPEASPTMPKKRGRPPKVTRSEDSQNS